MHAHRCSTPSPLRPVILLLLIWTLVGPAGLAAQIDLARLADMKARSVGPAGSSGRVTAIDVVVSDRDVIYVGGAAGGVWRSVNGGISWEPIFDDQPVLSIGAIAVNQANPDIIWVGTGEGSPRNSANNGNGIYRSIDGGSSWTHLGLEDSRVIHRIVLHPTDPDVAYLAVPGSQWGDSEERGVYRTRNGGETWERVLYTDARTGAADLVMDPRNPNKLIASMWSHRRRPWFFESGGEGSGIHVSYDGGDTWTERGPDDGLPEGELGRIGLAIAKNAPDIVYAIVEAEKSVLLRSEDGGRSFETVNSDPGVNPRPFYYADIFVDPSNENRLYRVAGTVDVSEDGGRSFETLVSGELVHVDHHAWWIHPEDPSYILNGNDGGAAISRDRGKTWRVIPNLPLGQFYHVNVDMEIPYNIFGGLQDNDSWRGPAYVWKVGGIRNYYWENLGCCADGFDMFPDPRDPRYGYSQYQGGTLLRYDRDTGNLKLVSPTDASETRLRFNWNAAIAPDPIAAGTVYAGSQFLHVSRDDGNTWQTISPDLTTNDPEKQNQHETGGLTIDDSGAENYTTIVAISPSPVERGVIWVGTDDGNVQVTRDGGATWTNTVDRMPGAPSGAWVPQVKASRFRGGEAFAILEDHRRDDWTPYVFHTNDYGESWRRMAEGVDGYAMAIEQDVEEPNLMFLGTDRGLWVSFDGGGEWQRWTHGFPNAPARDLVVHPREHDLIVATFGRSVFVLDDIRPLRALAREGGELLDRSLHLFPVPDAYDASVAHEPSTFFPGHAKFAGENRPFGARITYSVNPPEAESSEDDGDEADDEDEGHDEDEGKEEGDEDEDRVTLQILDGDEVIRTPRVSAESGVQRTTWALDRAGVRPPSRSEPDEDADEPSGPSVLPGTYTVRLVHGADTVSGPVVVRADPRTRFDRSDAIVVDGLWDRYLDMVGAAGDLADRLRDAETTVERIAELMEERDDAAAEAVKDAGKAAKDSIEALQGRIVPAQIQGFRSEPGVLSSQLRAAALHLRSGGWEAPTEGARRQLERAEVTLTEVSAVVEAFFEGVWSEYRASVAAAHVDLFAGG